MKANSKLTINAPAKTVFLWLEDAERLRKWVPNIVEDEALVETPDKVGSKFRQVYLENGKRMEMIGEITEYTQDKSMRVDILGDMFDLDVAYTVTEIGPAQSELTQNTHIKFKGVMKLFSPIFSLISMFKSGSPQDESLAKLKTMAEAEYNEGGNSS